MKSIDRCGKRHNHGDTQVEACYTLIYKNDETEVESHGFVCAECASKYRNDVHVTLIPLGRMQQENPDRPGIGIVKIKFSREETRLGEILYTRKVYGNPGHLREACSLTPGTHFMRNGRLNNQRGAENYIIVSFDLPDPALHWELNAKYGEILDAKRKAAQRDPLGELEDNPFSRVNHERSSFSSWTDEVNGYAN